MFDVNVIKSLDSSNDKVDGILKNRLPVEDTKIAFDLKDNEASIMIPEEILRADGLQIMKHLIQLDIFKFVSTLEKLVLLKRTSTNKHRKRNQKQKKRLPN